jgi:glucose-fructose oxidoreductase
MKFATRAFTSLLLLSFLTVFNAAAADSGPLRVAIAGLVHGHVDGFFSNSLHRADIKIVGISEADRSLFDRYAKKYGLDSSLYHADLEEMLSTTKPQAVLVYSDTFDHRKIVEICAKQHIPVMMEKPLAVSFQDAQAIERAAREGNIVVLVNYETSWYRSNHAAFDMAHHGEIGDIRKVVVHD